VTGQPTTPRRSRYEEGEVLGGKFKIIRVLGAGGMGVVYEVQHVITFHRRALKLLLLNEGDDLDSNTDDESASARLLREASAAGRIGNEHIVETFDAGVLPSGETYVVMELLEGESMSDLLKRRIRLPVDEAADLIAQVCDGLQAAHDAGIIHRDLKPGNLWVMQRDGRPFVKILDFGISKFDTKLTDETELTRKGALLGTPYYMSPEQLNRETADARSDVYALGIILYLALTGQRPYAGSSLMEMVMKLARREHTPIRAIRSDIPEDFVAIVDRAMAPIHDERTPTARRLGEELALYNQRARPTAGNVPDVREMSDISVLLSEPPPPLEEGSSTSSAASRRTRLAGSFVGGVLVVSVVGALIAWRAAPSAASRAGETASPPATSASTGATDVARVTPALSVSSAPEPPPQPATSAGAATVSPTPTNVRPTVKSPPSPPPSAPHETPRAPRDTLQRTNPYQ